MRRHLAVVQTLTSARATLTWPYLSTLETCWDLDQRSCLSHRQHHQYATTALLGGGLARRPSWSDVMLQASCPGFTGERHGSSKTQNAGPSGMRLQLPGNPFESRRRRAPPVPRLVLYKGPGMLLFRIIVRGKVFQLLGALTVSMLVSAMLTAQDFRPLDLAAAGGLAVGCIVTSYCVWFYSSRYVGEMSLLLPERRVVRFSVLNFWGNRQDDDVPVEDIVAPFQDRSVGEVRALTRRLLLPVDVRGGQHQYFISVAHGNILEKQILQQLFYGKHLEDVQADIDRAQSPDQSDRLAATSASPSTGDSQDPQSEQQRKSSSQPDEGCSAEQPEQGVLPQHHPSAVVTQEQRQSAKSSSPRSQPESSGVTGRHITVGSQHTGAEGSGDLDVQRLSGSSAEGEVGGQASAGVPLSSQTKQPGAGGTGGGPRA